MARVGGALRKMAFSVRLRQVCGNLSACVIVGYRMVICSYETSMSCLDYGN